MFILQRRCQKPVAHHLSRYKFAGSGKTPGVSGKRCRRQNFILKVDKAGNHPRHDKKENNDAKAQIGKKRP
jgi:hypothetical protein